MPAPSNVITYQVGGNTVYHLGTLFDGQTPVNLGPYSVGTITVPNHWWNARWVDRPTPLSAIVSPSQIVSSRRMFPVGDIGKTTGAVKNYTYAGPMDTAGITIYMPTTGERPDIGLITDPAALFMKTGNPGPMLAWAQGASSFPGHYRDETTGRPIDLLKYPEANDYNSAIQGHPILPQGPQNAKGIYVYGGGLTPQQAHYCEMVYVAYQAAKDAVLLEELQYGANFVHICDAGLSHRLGKATIRGEYRGVSWGLRTLFMAHIATKDAEAAGALPPSCHPSSYFKTLLDNALSYYSAAITDPAREVFRLVVLFPQFAPWQVDYMLSALAFGVLTGHSDWTPLYLWALKNAIDRMSGKSGYPPGYGDAYYLNPALPDWKTAWLTGIPTLQGAEPPTQAEIDALAIDPFNNYHALHGPEYMETTRAVLIQGQYLDDFGLAPVRATYPDLDACASTAHRMVLNNVRLLDLRHSFVSVSATTTPPIPTTGDITMSTPVLNGPFTATVHFLDDAEVERPVDSVDWTASGAASFPSDPGHGNVATGVYNGTGAFEIDAVGHVAGAPDIAVKVTGSVPVPFPTHGRIDLS